VKDERTEKNEAALGHGHSLLIGLLFATSTIAGIYTKSRFEF